MGTKRRLPEIDAVETIGSSDHSNLGSIRLIKDAELVEISAVTFPSDNNAIPLEFNNIKNSDILQIDKRSMEANLRDAGCSREQAKTVTYNLQHNKRDACDNEDNKNNDGLNEVLQLLQRQKEDAELNKILTAIKGY